MCQFVICFKENIYWIKAKAVFDNEVAGIKTHLQKYVSSIVNYPIIFLTLG